MKWWFLTFSLVGLAISGIAFYFTIDIKREFTSYESVQNMLNRMFVFDMSGDIAPMFNGSTSSIKEFIIVLLFDSLLSVLGICGIGFGIYGIVEEELVNILNGFILGALYLIFGVSQMGMVAQLYDWVKNTDFTYSIDGGTNGAPTWFWGGKIENLFFYDSQRGSFILNVSSPIVKLARAEMGVGIVGHIVAIFAPIGTSWLEED